MDPFVLAHAKALSLGVEPHQDQIDCIAMAAEQLAALKSELRELEVVLWWIPENHPLAAEFPANTTGATVLVHAPRYGDHHMLEKVATSGYVMTSKIEQVHGLTSITFGRKPVKTTTKKGKK